MKSNSLLLLVGPILLFIAASCSSPEKTDAARVEANAKSYRHTWDEILNKGKLDMFNDTNFTSDVIIHANPKNAVGIDSAKAFYANYLTGFSNIQFIQNDVFGQGDKLVKHWTFKGKHTGPFFGIPATGKTVNLEGTTLIRMKDGKIAEEQDFFDNLEFSQQLGLIPR